jgi:hypothetical protein
MRVEWAAAFIALLIAHPACGEPYAGWEANYDDETKEWKEIVAQMPPAPLGKNLVLLNTDAYNVNRFYVDPPSVSVGTDGVVRYTAVVKAGGGALNVTFEGIRCLTRELKIYAVGRRDGTWTRARGAKWERIARGSKPHQFSLYRDYFCPSPSNPTPPKQALDAMRRGVSLGSSSTID